MADSDVAISLHDILVKDNRRVDPATRLKALDKLSGERVAIPPASALLTPIKVMDCTVYLRYSSLQIDPTVPFTSGAKVKRKIGQGNKIANARRANGVTDDSKVESSAPRASPAPHPLSPILENETHSSKTSGDSISGSSSTLSLTSLMSTSSTPPRVSTSAFTSAETPEMGQAQSRSASPQIDSSTHTHTQSHKRKSSAHQHPRTPSSNPVTSVSQPRSNLSKVQERSIWDPDDDEWETNFASATIRTTFISSFRVPIDPGLSAPTVVSASALGRWGNTVRETWRTLRAGSPWRDDHGDGGSDDGDGRGSTQQALDNERGEEELRDKLDMLNNAYYTCPTGDLHDEIISSHFITGSRYLSTAHPTTPPSPQTMHILSLPTYFSPSASALTKSALPRLSTAIATILSHTSAACLSAFLDPRVEEFIYRREVDRNKAGLILVIRRQGNKVITGGYRNFGFKLQWVAYVRAVVGVRGEWVEIYTATGPGYTGIREGVVAWDDFWGEGEERGDHAEGGGKEGVGPRRLALTGPEKKEDVDEEGVSPVEPKFMLYQSRVLARALLWDIWARFDALNECRATWEADGVVTDVRLQRVLLGFGKEDEE